MDGPRQMDEWSSAEAASPSQGINIVRMLFRRKWLIVFATLVGAGLGYLSYAQEPEVYESSARILVVRQDTRDAPLEGPAAGREYADEMATQMLLIRSPVIVSDAVETHKLSYSTITFFVRHCITPPSATTCMHYRITHERCLDHY